MRRRLLATLLLAVCPVMGQKIVLNVGTAAPEGSPWQQILQKTREDWNRISGGRFAMRIFPSGIQGDEVEMTRKVRIGQLQAVGVSGVGLAHVEPGVACLQIPMLIGSYEEFDYIRDRIAPRLEAMIEQRGFVVLQWSDVGWVQFFTKTSARTPDDIRKLKLFTTAGDPEGRNWPRSSGYRWCRWR
jgi:TRAP-type C4-dicarboxylate transport system substrate-binding protein